MTNTKCLLIVDDEPRALHDLYRTLRGLPGAWNIRCAANAADALELMAQRPADVILTDLYMPGMDGLQLLRRVRKDWPDTLRLVMSGFSDQEQAMQPEGLAHQFLRKPCLAEAVHTAISRGQKLSRRVPTSKPLSEQVARVQLRQAGSSKSLPMPDLLDSLILDTRQLRRPVIGKEPIG